MRYVAAILLLLLFATVLGKICGRLLGVRLGGWRGLIIGVAGWFAGVATAQYALGEQVRGNREIPLDGFSHWSVALAVIIFFGVMASMPIAIGLDLLTRNAAGLRARRRRGIPRPVRSMKAALAPYGRLREVVGHARENNLLHLRYASRAALESPDLSRRLRKVLEDSGGMLVKLGQIASTRSDVLPAALTTELSNLRADVRPVPEHDVRTQLEAELDEPVEQAFASFEWEPLAAASIGQIHRAVLADGTAVVVKVQRPGIGDVVARDASVLRLAASRLERYVEAARSIGMKRLTEELISGLEEELDFMHEAAVGKRMAENRADDVGVDVPRVHATLSTGRILVMDEVKGRSVADQEALDASPVGREELARRLLSSFIGQVLDDGLFHADPHPGNMMIDGEGNLWLLDFGSVGRLDARAHDGLRDMSIAVATNDPSLLARAARDLAGNDGLVDLRALELDMGQTMAQLEAPGGLDPRLIGEVLGVMQRHGMRPPASMTLLARALVTLQGTLQQLAPDFSFVSASREVVFEDHANAFGTPQEILQREAIRQLPALRTLPEHAETLANQLRAGQLTVRTERYAGNDHRIVDGWVDRAVIAGLGGFGTLAAAVVLFAAATTDDDNVQAGLWVLGFAGLTFGSILMMRSAARALRRLRGRIDD